MSQDYDSDPGERFLQDELIDLITNGPKNSNNNNNHNNQIYNQYPLRQVKLILDQTAFVRGIGNIKRWFNEEYINQNFNRNSDPILLNLYIPSYTLHEFEFVKKGTSISATNAREAIKFIDQHLENYNYQDQNNLNNENQPNDQIKYNVNLETPNDNTPSWNQCLKYKVYSPKIKDFPNYKTRFESSLLPSQQPITTETNNQKFRTRSERKNSIHDNKFQIHYENSPSYQNALQHSNSFAEMPPRLKYLIRTCIYKRFLEKSPPSSSNSSQQKRNSIEEWKLVTEDSITKIWAQSFGIDCVNVNEAELLIFQNYDVNSFKIYNPFSLNDDEIEINNILQSKIDTTTLYQYETIDQEPPKLNFKYNKRGNRRNSGNPKTYIANEGAVHEEIDNNSVNGYIKKEKFQAINYAPRGNGQLWRP
ncbi:NMD4 [Candida jiufengensis]|uniref:NMD4 n=1 Tax=Candida jiufengensis TaxID=497108 RepID=UPI0022249627|nr:NMD4 [Candida jiufengensis]KAI5951358.1 NMD4 [Candida jiufengensis]